MTPPRLDIRNLDVTFASRRGTVRAVRDVSLALHRGRTLALVGESGSGKSVTAMAALGLIGLPGRVSAGTVAWDGLPPVPANEPERLRFLRGGKVGVVFQNPMTSLNPLLSIGAQVGEAARLHLGLTRGAARARATELLADVQVSDPARRLAQLPHELSGGMRQRVMIASALAGRPQVLVADEPTTALDVTVQAQLLGLLRDIQAEMSLSMLLISHDLGVVAAAADEVALMYAGRIVELGPAAALFKHPAHPYMAGLLRSTPRGGTRGRLASVPGAPPDLRAVPSGCAFRPRCPIAMARCEVEDPPLMPVAKEREAACWRAFEPAWERAA